jgi:hypothetical protein
VVPNCKNIVENFFELKAVTLEPYFHGVFAMRPKPDAGIDDSLTIGTQLNCYPLMMR